MIKNKKIIISVIIVIRNEEKYIYNCIKSINNQFVEFDINWELIVVDGSSEDNSISVAQKAVRDLKIKNFCFYNNPQKILATGWNIAIKNSNGEYLIRPDAHSTLGTNYIKKCFEIIKSKPEVGAVGGLLNTKSRGFWGEIIKQALSSKVAVGSSPFRTKTRSGYKDTVVFALYRKTVFEKVGFFNENLIRHQDTEFHKRIIDCGFKFWQESTISANYYCRDNVYDLLIQMFNIGLYLPDLIKVGIPTAIRPRHFAPFGFYSFLLVTICLIKNNKIKKFGIVSFISYIATLFFNTTFHILKNNKICYLLMFPIILLMHISYALGTFMGIFNLTINKISKEKNFK